MEEENYLIDLLEGSTDGAINSNKGRKRKFNFLEEAAGKKRRKTKQAHTVELGRLSE